MAISSVGTIQNAGGTGVHTLTVAPAGVGNLLIIGTVVTSTTVHFSSLSGGGCTTWTHLLGPTVVTTNSLDLWMGTVTTAGSSTLTGTGSAALTSLNCDLSAQEFAGGGAGVVWAVDGSQSATKSNASSITVTWPTLTPVGAGRLYAGFGTSAQGMSTTGYTAGYTGQNTTNLAAIIYNVSVSTAQTPTGATGFGTAALSGTQGVLLTATAPAGATNGFMPFFGP
jgi:hypothetical protein